MREFDYDDEEFQDEMDDLYDEYEEEYEAGLAKKDVLRAMELEILENSMDLNLLTEAIKMLEKSFWWRFYSFKTRMKMITQAYAVMDKLVMEVRDRRKQKREE